MALYVHYGLSADSFVDPIIGIFESIERENPLAKKDIVAQNQSIATWISLAVAEKRGVCVSKRQVSPEAYLKSFASEHLGLDTEGSVFEKKRLVWALYGILEELRHGDDPDFAAIRGYMAESNVKPFQLAGKIAYLFDQYLVYRPDLIAGWKNGRLTDPSDRDEIWQFRLFRRLSESHPDSLTKYDFHERFAEGCRELKRRGFRSSRHVILLDVSLDEYLFSLFQSLSELIDVYIFCFYPSSEMLDREIENPIVNRFSKGERYFYGQTCGLCSSVPESASDGVSRLSALQRSVFSDEKRFSGCAAGDDGSVRVSACWSKMREVEELKTELVKLFKSDPSLLPEDVAVAAPDISEYAVELETQFAGFDEIPAALPVLRGSGVRETFLLLLDLCGSNFERSRVLEIFENPSVLKRFGVRPESCGELFDLIAESGVKWGIDGAHRERTGCSEGFQNTWETGLKRIFTGCVMPFTDNFDDFNGAIPVGDLTGEKAEDFAKFSLFFSALAGFDAVCSEPRSLAEWQSIMQQSAVDGFFFEDETSYRELKLLRESIDGLSAGEGVAPEMVPFETVRDFLKRRLDGAQVTPRAAKGRVTFCSIRSLSMIPFRTVFLIGMSAEAFPREDGSLAFDLTRKGGRAVRSLKNDDIFMFLKVLMTVRDSLVISYVGKSQNSFSDGRELLPVSSAVSELCEYLTGTLSGFSDTVSVKPMNSYSFIPLGTDSRPAEVRFEEKKYDSGTVEVSLDELAAFFKDPAKQYLTKRAGIVLPKLDSGEGDDEIFDFDSLGTWKLREGFLHEPDEDEIIRRARLTGNMPFGEFGAVKIREALGELYGLLEAAEAARGGLEATPQDISLNYIVGGKDVRLYGRIDPVYGKNLVYLTASKCKKIENRFRPLIYAFAFGMKQFDWRLTVISPDAKNGTLLDSLQCPDYPVYLRTMLEIYCDALDELPFFSPKSVEAAEKEKEDERLRKAVLELLSAGSDGVAFDFSSEYSQFIQEHWSLFAPLFDYERLEKTCGYSRKLAEIVSVLFGKKTKKQK